VLPFRTALIGAARDAIASAGHVSQVWIQPLSIAYVSQQGIALGRHLRPRAAWYGKMKLTEHIGAIVRSGAIDVSVTWGEPIPTMGGRPQGLGKTAGIVNSERYRFGFTGRLNSRIQGG
jgi:1-acyl-sn-glycerol-3-phosphate acyltransferase